MGISFNYLRICRSYALATAFFGLSGAAVAEELSLQEQIEQDGPGFTIRVVDEAGKPVAGAIAGLIAGSDDGKPFAECNDDLIRTDSEGVVHLPYGRKLLGGGSAAAWHDERKLAGFRATNADDAKNDMPLEIAI